MSDLYVDLKKYYEMVVRPNETSEFKEWFDLWYGGEAQFIGNPLHELYLSERRFALAGWLAALSDEETRKNPVKFNKEFLKNAAKYTAHAMVPGVIQ